MSALLFGLPGSPYLYQGEELGLDEANVPLDQREDPLFLRTAGAHPGRDGCRTPLPWTAGTPGLGFTAGTPWLPFGADAAALAADLQCEDPGSTLSAYRRLLACRRAVLPGLPAQVELLDTDPDVLAYRRGPLVVVLNTAAEPVQVPVSSVDQLLEATAEGAVLEDGVVTVPAAATVWLRG